MPAFLQERFCHRGDSVLFDRESPGQKNFRPGKAEKAVDFPWDWDKSRVIGAGTTAAPQPKAISRGTKRMPGRARVVPSIIIIFDASGAKPFFSTEKV